MIYDNPFVAKKEKWESKHLVIFHFPKWKVKRKGAGDGCCLIASVFNDFLIHLFTGAAQALSSCDEEGLLSSCGSQASFCGC